MLNHSHIADLICTRLETCTIGEAVAESGLARATISQLSRGFAINVSASTLGSLASWLGVSTDSLYLQLNYAA